MATDLQTFVLVAELGTMQKAAQSMGVPTSTVSRRILRLENELGLDLLRRAHRSFTLTDDGVYLASRCRPLLTEIDDIMAGLSKRDSEPRGLLKVTMPPDIGTTPFLSGLLAQFMKRWPQVVLDVELSNRLVLLAEEGYDVALRSFKGRLPDNSVLMARRLGGIPFALYASPEYCREQGEPDSVEVLPQRRCMVHRISLKQPGWTLVNTQGEEVTVHFDPYFGTNDFGLILSMVREGLGIAVLPTFLAGPHARRGEIIRILPEWLMGVGSISAFYPRSRHLSPQVRVFIDFLVEAFKQNSDFVHRR